MNIAGFLAYFSEPEQNRRCCNEEACTVLTHLLAAPLDKVDVSMISRKDDSAAWLILSCRCVLLSDLWLKGRLVLHLAVKTTPIATVLTPVFVPANSNLHFLWDLLSMGPFFSQQDKNQSGFFSSWFSLLCGVKNACCTCLAIVYPSFVKCIEIWPTAVRVQSDCCYNLLLT